MAAEKEFRLPNPPSDAIQSVRWGAGRSLVAAAWDSTVRVYDVGAPDALRAQWKHRGPALDAAFVSSTQVVSGGLDADVLLHDIAAGRDSILGTHGGAVKCVEPVPRHNIVITGSWDSTAQCWDPRAGADACVASVAAPERVYSLTLAGENTLVCACAKRHIALYDVRQMHRGAVEGSMVPVLRDSPIKYMTRCVRATTDGRAYIVASVEGRCAVVHVSDDDAKSNFAFKAHRQKLPSGEERIHPIHAVAFHPGHGTFATGGGDGFVHTWDHRTRQRVATIADYPTSVAALDFSHDGSQLAIAVSYAFEQGDVAHPADEIVIRNVAEEEVKPRPKGAVAAP